MLLLARFALAQEVLGAEWMLHSLAQAMKSRLKHLDLHGTKGFGDLGLKALAAFCEGLEELRLGGCDVTDDGVEKVAKFCPSLRAVELTENTRQITASSLQHFGAACAVERFHDAERISSHSIRAPLSDGDAEEEVEAPEQQLANRWVKLRKASRAALALSAKGVAMGMNQVRRGSVSTRGRSASLTPQAAAAAAPAHAPAAAAAAVATSGRTPPPIPPIAEEGTEEKPGSRVDA